MVHREDEHEVPRGHLEQIGSEKRPLSEVKRLLRCLLSEARHRGFHCFTFPAIQNKTVELPVSTIDDHGVRRAVTLHKAGAQIFMAEDDGVQRTLEGIDIKVP